MKKKASERLPNRDVVFVGVLFSSRGRGWGR